MESEELLETSEPELILPARKHGGAALGTDTTVPPVDHGKVRVAGAWLQVYVAGGLLAGMFVVMLIASASKSMAGAVVGGILVALALVFVLGSCARLAGAYAALYMRKDEEARGGNDS